MLLQKIEKLRESRRIMKTEIRNAKSEIQELREQITMLFDDMIPCQRKGNVIERTM